MGFFDDLKLIFSKEGQENIKKYKEQEKEESMSVQKEILDRRKDPRKMREYEENRSKKRMELAEESLFNYRYINNK